MKIFTAKQLQELDAYTVRNEPIESYDLMERAATAMTKVLLSRFGEKRKYIVFAGPGNNGGDALAIARMLAVKGATIDAYIFNTGKRISENCAANVTKLSGMKTVRVTEITKQFDLVPLSADDIVIDGLFGNGINKPLAGGYASLVNYINAQDATVVSIDVPSGLMCEDNTFNVLSNVIRADITLSVELPKLSFFLPDTGHLAGEVINVPIGLSREYIDINKTPYTTQSPEDVAPLLMRRDAFGHKGVFGHGLLIAGSYGMAGAAVMAARAAMRSGIGKLTVHIPSSCLDIMQISVPEAVLSIDSGLKYFTRAENAVTYDAVAVGPGLGNFHDTATALIEEVRNCPRPLVIDADGINILAEHRTWLSQLPRNTILTPHPGEFARLIDSKLSGYAALEAARNMAMKYQFYIVLKGHYTAINTPTGHTFINCGGNSGMATAGSGDVLTGIILALLSEGYDAGDACRLGVAIHSLAGDMAAAELSQEAMTASDIVSHLPGAFLRMHELQRQAHSSNNPHQ